MVSWRFKGRVRSLDDGEVIHDPWAAVEGQDGAAPPPAAGRLILIQSDSLTDRRDPSDKLREGNKE